VRNPKAITVLATVCFLAFGCSDSTGPGDAGFTATIGGDLDLSVSGDAIFGVASEGGVDRWMIFLTDGVFLGLDYDMIAISREASGAPIAVGTHTILDAASDALEADDIVGAYMIGRHDGTLGVFSSVSGTLTVTSASSERVVGSFDFSATMQIAVGPQVRDARNLTLTGSFTAEAGTIPSGTSN
jgi:hypothetical protein